MAKGIMLVAAAQPALMTTKGYSESLPPRLPFLPGAVHSLLSQ